MPVSLMAFVEGVGFAPSNLHIGLAALGSSIAVGLIGMAASTAVGRNPGGATKILVQSILAIAFAEAIMFYTLFLVKQ
jgi:F-type H+-transporting ATPase subunit c